MTDRARFVLVLACFLLSGAAGLVYQTAWTQELTLVFGASEPAVAAVLAAYMAGLALGAAAAGRWQHRVRRPVRTYAWIELAIGAAALAVPAALALARRVQAGLLGGLETLPEGGGAGSTLFYLATSFLVLLVPTTLMGATLPLLVRHAVRRDRQIGARPALLYAVNTVGAAIGVLLAAFVLLPALALESTVWVGVGLNVVVFLLAARLAIGEDAPESAPPPPADPVGGFWILPVILVCGAVSFTWEILWVRLLTHVLGGSTFAFGAMLATFLAGIALGSAVAARFATDRERARHAFAWTQVAVAGLSLVAFAAVDRLPDLAYRLGAGAASLASGVALSAATLLPGALAMGATFPLAVRLLSGAAGETAVASARVYAWNTVGAILGAVGTGFLVLPALGIPGTVAAAAGTSLALAIVASLAGSPRRTLPLLAAIAIVAGLALLPPDNPWRVLRHSVLRSAEPRAAGAGGEVVFHGVGRSATVLLVEQGGEWRLTTNGLPESVIQPPGARPGRYQITRWLSLLPQALRPDARTMMVVGLGAGNTVEYLPASFESVDVVEIEPEVVAANRFLADRRGRDPLSDPRVELHVNDARGAMTLTRKRYDAIVSQPSHPWTAGASHLFTREFFTLSRERLEPDGVFLQWIGLAFVDEELVRTLVATLADVFEHVEVYRPTAGALLFAASQAPLDPAVTAPRAVASDPDFWGVVGVLDGAEVVALRVLDDAGARAFSAGAELNTDRRNLLRTRSPRILRSPLDPRQVDEMFAAYDTSIERPGRRPLYTVRQLLRRGQPARARRLAASLTGADRATAQALTELAAGRPRVAAQALARVLTTAPGHLEAFSALAHLRQGFIATGRAPDLARRASSESAKAVLEAWTASANGDWDGLRSLESRLAAVPIHDPFHGAAVGLRAEWRRREGDAKLAAEAVRLLDPLLVPSPQSQDLLARADLGRLSGRPEIALGSLSELLLRPVERPQAEAARRILLGLPDASREDSRYRWVSARLR